MPSHRLRSFHLDIAILAIVSAIAAGVAITRLIAGDSRVAGICVAISLLAWIAFAREMQHLYLPNARHREAYSPSTRSR